MMPPFFVARSDKRSLYRIPTPDQIYRIISFANVPINFIESLKAIRNNAIVRFD